MAASRSTIKFDEYLDGWFATARQSLRPTTARGYAHSIGRLAKVLGNYQLQSLTPMQVQRCYTELLESGGHEGKPLAPKTVRHAHVVLRKALANAERMGLVSRNAAASAQPPAGEHAEMTTWSSEDLRDVLAAVDGHPYEIGFRLLTTTGSRRREVLGLRWRDVDVDLGQIAVAATCTSTVERWRPCGSTGNVNASSESRPGRRGTPITTGCSPTCWGLRARAVDVVRVAQADRAARPAEDSPPRLCRPPPHPRTLA